MRKQGERAVCQIIMQLQQKLWENIAIKYINKMVPCRVENMNILTFESLTKLNTDLQQPKGNISQIKNDENIQKDNFLNGSVQVQKRQIKMKGVYEDQKGLGIRKKNTIVSSVSSVGVKTIGNLNRTKTTIKNSLLVQLEYSKQRQRLFKTTNVQNNEQLNKKIQNLREKLIFIDENCRKQKQDMKRKQQMSIQRRIELEKKKGKINKFTFDYNGQFFGSKISNPQSSLGLTKLKSVSVNEAVTTPVGNIQKVQPVFTRLINHKLQQRFLKMKTESVELQELSRNFNQNISSRRSKFAQSQDFHEGVSVNGEESSGQRYTSQERAKTTLKQFKKQIIDKRFTSFRIKPLFGELKNVSLQRKKINSYKSEQNFIDMKQNNKCKQVCVFGGRRKIKTTYQSQQTSIISNSKVSKIEYNGKILVSNQSLYSSVFQQQTVL